MTVNQLWSGVWLGGLLSILLKLPPDAARDTACYTVRLHKAQVRNTINEKSPCQK